MTNQNFSTTISADRTPQEAFDAINNVRGWWSEEVEGSTNKLGDEFTYHYKDVHSCKMKLIEVIPTNKVVWLVLDNHFNFTEDKSEWKGTKVIFEISKKDGKTEVRFTHLGLVPEYECFNVCSNAWGSYINGSLRSLITAGTLTDSDGPPDMTWETAEDVDKVKINKQSDFALVAFSGASHSQELLDLASDQAREAALLKQLSGVYPEIAAQITNSKFMDWPSKLFTQGSSYFPAPDEVTSWGPSWKTGYLDWLHFAGEHTSYAFMGYMEGALSSGFRLARRLAVRDQLLP